MELLGFILLCAIPAAAFVFCVVKAWLAWLELVELRASGGSEDD